MILPEVARNLANDLILELQKTQFGTMQLNIDYSVGPENYRSFIFAYHSSPYRLIFDLRNGRITRYRLTNPQTHRTLDFGPITEFNARRLHLIIIKETKERGNIDGSMATAS